jgi:hypothetical protein
MAAMESTEHDVTAGDSECQKMGELIAEKTALRLLC